MVVPMSLMQIKDFHNKIIETPYGEVLAIKDTDVRSRLVFKPSTGDGIPGIFVFREDTVKMLDPEHTYGIMICSQKNTTLFWFRGGKTLHRDNGPAIIDYGKGRDGTTWVTRYFIRDGKRHRENGPAVESYRGVGITNPNISFGSMIGVYHHEGQTISSLQTRYDAAKGDNGADTDVIFGLPVEFLFDKGTILNDTPWEQNLIPVLFWMRDLNITITRGSVHLLAGNFNRITGSMMTSVTANNFSLVNDTVEGMRMVQTPDSSVQNITGLRKAETRNERITVDTSDRKETLFQILASYDILRGGLKHSDLRHMFMYDILGAEA